MILKVSIGEVEVLFDDDVDERPEAAYRDDALNTLRLNAINTWMALPTIIQADEDLNNVDLETEAATDSGDA